MPKKKNAGTELQGLTRLVAEATIGVTDLVEAMHRRIVHPPFLPSTPIQHLITDVAGITYKSIKHSTRFIGWGLDKALGHLAPMLGEIKNTPESEAVRSTLNGVIGDYLEEKENPLQIEMVFRRDYKKITLDRQSLANTFPTINGKILLLVHGSCLNEQHWTRNGHNHGTALAKELDKQLIYLHYNSGRHISYNGKGLSDLLEQLIQNWPVPVEELVIMGHSMGGLVIRSALHYGPQHQRNWIKYLNKVIFLGTPHHGAPMERAGSYMDFILESIPYAKPFARLGKIRSAGITDLRYGNLVDEDWHDYDRFDLHKDQRQNIPLPNDVAFYSVAASKSKTGDHLLSKVVGDGLVDVRSALGQHKDQKKNLGFKKENIWIAHENTHLDLLSSLEVYERIKDWLGN